MKNMNLSIVSFLGQRSVELLLLNAYNTGKLK
jgi:hypothetical protein